jgi:ABC-type transporter Mla maintaining outer membrane lipid asymmetry ATPase subunit MlaF
MTQTQPAIDVADMTAVYHEQPVLWDVDLQVPAGVLMAIVGVPLCFAVAYLVRKIPLASKIL